MSHVRNEFGRLVVTNTEPSLSIAEGKGLTKGLQGKDCNFRIVTKDWQGQTTYSEIDEVDVDIQSLQTGRVAKPIITDSKDGSYEVTYKIEDAGDFSVSITVGGEAITGSPFGLKVKERASKSKQGVKGRGQLAGLNTELDLKFCHTMAHSLKSCCFLLIFSWATSSSETQGQLTLVG